MTTLTPLRLKSLSWMFVISGYATSATAQPTSLHPEIDRLKNYAPIMWLASGEPFYPTLPHPYAFDGLDNDGDRKIDLDDPDEIALALRLLDKHARLADLEANFRFRRPEPRIMYRAPEDFPFDKDLTTIQLWFYYVADVGSGSHEGDSEHAFIFINKYGPVSTVGRPRAGEEVRAVVGAGHTGDTANNIVATGSLQSSTGVMPAHLPRHMPLLVELGKHATAPDVTMDGRFNRGIDCNVFRHACWGSRDGFGLDVLEFLSGYREVYSLPRNIKDVILERDALLSHRREYELEFPHHFNDVDQFRDNLKYRFFPIADLRKVFDILAGARGVSDTVARAQLTAFLEQHAECFWPPKDEAGQSLFPGSFKLEDEAFAAFLGWLDHQNGHVKVWTKRDFEHPDDIFKTYLYPRIQLGLSSMWTQDKPTGQLRGVSLNVAEFSIGRIPFMNDSSLEVYANFKEPSLGLYDFGLTYRYFRGGFGGPYFGMGWRGEERRGTEDLSADERDSLIQNFGPAVADVPRRYERHTGIDVGYAIAWNMGRFPKGRALRMVTLGADIGVRSELFAENLSPVEEALNPDLPRHTRFQAKFTLRVAVLGPRHPLRR